jgi:hypothetical protein
VLGLAALARVFGCHEQPLPLDTATRHALHAPARSRVSVVSGPDERRLLLVSLPRSTNVRQAVAALAKGVIRESPHLYWAIVARAREGQELIIAACGSHGGGARVSALTVRIGRISSSDIETVRLLADSSIASAAMAHARWMEILGREGIGRRFFLTLAGVVERMALESASAPRTTMAESREVALLCVSRLLFLAFLEAKGWLDGDHDFLQRHFARVSSGGKSLHTGLLRPLLFGTLNTRHARRAPTARAFGRVPFLNGGLFTPTPLERRSRVQFSDSSLGALFGDLLARWSFTAREDSAAWSGAAVDPEMLGRAFESLMAEGERRRGGVYYTPHELVRRTTREALADALARDGVPVERVLALLGGGASPDSPSPARGAMSDDAVRGVLLERARSIRVLDPACGSGAFLVHVLETLADMRGMLGDSRPVSLRRREVLVRQIVGVDMNPVAVWLCQLRLWLSVAVEDQSTDPSKVLPLPNLDRHILVGDALDSDMAPPGVRRSASVDDRGLERTRERYARATGVRKRTLGGVLTRAERARADRLLGDALELVAHSRRELIVMLRSRDLFGERAEGSRQARARLDLLKELTRELRARRRRLRDGGALPFSFDVHCGGNAGFDVVLGNPPWVRVHEIPPSVRERLRARYSVLRGSGWQPGSRAAGAGGGFGSQPEMSAAFVERALELAAPDGTVALLLPAKLWRTLSGAALRTHLAREARLVALEDWSDAPPLFDAVVYPSLLVARRSQDVPDADRPPARITVHLSPLPNDRGRQAPFPTRGLRTGFPSSWDACAADLSLDRGDPASPWLLLPPHARSAFDTLRSRGIALAESEHAGRPMLGVKTGFNAAFLVDSVANGSTCAHSAGMAKVTAGARSGMVEAELLRSVARGEDVRPWKLAQDRPQLVWTHDRSGSPLDRLPPGALEWLRPHRARLSARADARNASRWWSLFRLPAASSSRPRVVWADIDRRPSAAFLPAGDPTAPLNSCYVSVCVTDADALALVTLLNSPLAAAWLSALAEPARGGYRRFMGWTLALLPLPVRWREARTLLAPLAAAAHAGSIPTDADLLAAACSAYEVDERCMRPLLDWWLERGG